MEKGDKVTIIPNEKHVEHVKKHYGKTLEIEKVFHDEKTGNFYKVKGVEDYALESDLQPV